MTARPVYITQSAAFLPNAPVGNDDMERILGQVGGRPSRARQIVLRSNGILSRHYAIDPKTLAPTHTNAQLTAAAVQGLGEAIDISDHMNCLACGTSMPDQFMPNHAVMVQGELGLPAIEVVATSGVCLAGLTALKYAYLAIASGMHDTAVATGSDAPSPALSAQNFTAEIDARVESLEKNPELAFEKDFLRWMLSDGAGALLLQDAPRKGVLNLRIDWIETLSYAGEMETCMYAGAIKNEDGALTGWASMSAERRLDESVMSIKQDVRLLNDNIIHYTVERPLPGLVRKYGLTPAAIDYFVPHYSSSYFRQPVLDGLVKAGFCIPHERWFTNLTHKGNTGAASIYIALSSRRTAEKRRAGAGPEVAMLGAGKRAVQQRLHAPDRRGRRAMKVDEVPQETALTYGGVRKLLYAGEERGDYAGVNSAGWEPETYATPWPPSI